VAGQSRALTYFTLYFNVTQLLVPYLSQYSQETHLQHPITTHPLVSAQLQPRTKQVDEAAHFSRGLNNKEKKMGNLQRRAWTDH